MKTNLISIQEFCVHYNIPEVFINELQEHGLVEIFIQNKKQYLQTNELNTIERMMRLHYDLHINIEGIDVINNLLNQITSLQQQIIYMNNKLSRFEDL